MSRLLEATQRGVFAMLTAASRRGVPLYGHVPPDTQPPAIVIGEITLSPDAAKDGDLGRIDIEVQTYFRGPDRLKLYAIMADVDVALNLVRPVVDGFLFTPLRLTASGDELMDDGLTYAGRHDSKP